MPGINLANFTTVVNILHIGFEVMIYLYIYLFVVILVDQQIVDLLHTHKITR